MGRWSRSAAARLVVACGLACAVAAAGATAACAAGRVAVTLPVWHSSYDWAGGNGYGGWTSRFSSLDPFAYGFGQSLGGTPGLWLWLPGNRDYRPGYGEWRIQAPGTTRIANVDLELSDRDKLFAHHCLESGLRTAGEVRDRRRDCSPPALPATQERFDVSLADPSDRPLATEAYLRVEMPVCNNPADTPCSKFVPALDPLTNGAMARVKAVRMELVDDDSPGVTASGPLRELAERYIDGRRAYDVTVSASDPGAGTRRVALERVGYGDAFSSDGPCDPTHRTPALGSAICPRDHAATWAFDTDVLPEGAATFRGRGTDLAGNGDESAAWRVFVDRTAPPQPYDFDIDLDEETDTANVTWVADDDPNLVDGNPGSGLAGWEHRFFHPRLGWSDWHRGSESVEVPDSLEGDEIKVEVRSLDAVDNASPISAATLTIPTEDDEEDTQENLDDDEDEEPFAAASAASASEMTLTFGAASARERRDAALAEVRAACEARPLSKVRCYRAVKAACTVGGICRTAKQIACAGAKLYCPKSDVSRVSTVKRYQPAFVVETRDRFWPVSFSTALRMEWDGRKTCYMLYGDCVARGEKAIRTYLHPETFQLDADDLYLDLPPHKGDLEDHFKATQDALGFGKNRIDEDKPTSDDQWHRVYETSRVYWYRGGGYGRNTGTTKSLQYWTYWTYNYMNGGPGVGLVGKHESDLEMVAVVFNADNEPVWVHMSRHGNSLSKEARRFAWGDDRLIRIDGRDEGRPHPVAFAARGSHAMYHHEGEFGRPFPLPNDNFTSDTTRWLLFGGQRSDPRERMRLINLARQPWACWGGRLGQGGGGTDFSDAPQAPLWQQDVFGGDRKPCVNSRATATTAAASRTRLPQRRGSAVNAQMTRQSAAKAQARTALRTGDPLVNEFANCDSWNQAPDQPGLVVIACDQTQLDHFIASQLTDPGPGGAAIHGPAGAHSGQVPTVYADDDPGRMAGVTVTGSGTATGVYVGQMGWDGTLFEANLPAVALPRGEPLRIRIARGMLRLLGRDGRTLAQAELRKTQFSPFTRIPPVRHVRVRRHGTQATITWWARRDLGYHVNAAPTQSMNARLPKQVKPARTGLVSVRIRLEPSDRWIAVTAFNDSAQSPAVLVKVPRQIRPRPRAGRRRRSP